MAECGFFTRMYRGFFEEGYIKGYFLRTDDPIVAAMEPTFINFIKAQIHTLYIEMTSINAYDASMIFSKQFLQIILPFFAIIGGIRFYNAYNGIMKFQYSKKTKSSYRKNVFINMNEHSFKIALALFLSHVLFGLVMAFLSDELSLGALNRTLFSDILGSSFYQEHIVLYFILEDFVTIFMMSYAYTFLAESMVLMGYNIKRVVGTPLIYYYGMSVIGFALMQISNIGVYFIPSIYMSSGDYSFSTIPMILINMIPLFIAFLIFMVKTKYVEIQ